MSPVPLDGLDGRNPLAYFAALGCLSAVSRMLPERDVQLSWRPGPLPRPVLHGDGLDPDEVVRLLDRDRVVWHGAAALTFDGLSDVKLDADQQRRYLEACRNAPDQGRSAALAAALVAEGAFASTSGGGKPTDLHFTAGNQKFLVIARHLQQHVTEADLREAAFGPWRYGRSLPTFGWDLSDDRVYAYGFSDPAKTTKNTVPGADWLALVGLSAFPVRRAANRAIPPGASGTWKVGLFRWGVWEVPLTWGAARALIRVGFEARQATAIHAGVFRIYSSRIRRSDQGGYGSFSPSSVEWDASVAGPPQ